MLINVSIGEVLDKISILRIKEENIKDKEKLKNIKHELNKLIKLIPNYKNIPYYKNLLKINFKLWLVEEKIRCKEKDKQFDKQFIFLARAVYKFNDKRAEIKKNVNLLFKSKIIEEKSYIS